MPQELIQAMERAVEKMRQWPDKTVQLFHHNDSDGLTSGAILTRAFERAGYGVRRFCLEKPYPAVLEKVFADKGGLIVFTDFAGRIAPLISDLNRGRNLVLILDHHKASPANDPLVHNLNPELFGLKGDRDITASVTCYLFACTMDAGNKDLANIATIGAVGDRFFVDGRLVDKNREVALETVAQGFLEIREHERGESYMLKTSRGWMPCEEVAFYLDTLGAAGYYQDGPDAGIGVCLEGMSDRSDRLLAEYRAVQDRLFADQLARIRRGEIHQTPRIQWIHVENRFSPMGVKMIGAFLDEIKYGDDIDEHKYLAGFMTVPNKIPGFGPIRFDQAKISMRVSARLEQAIRNGSAPGLDTFLTAATAKLGGFSDACHSLTAATTVAIGKEEALIEEMENTLGSP